jgi:hypothetical protein
VAEVLRRSIVIEITGGLPSLPDPFQSLSHRKRDRIGTHPMVDPSELSERLLECSGRDGRWAQ